jgi:hypothetical protein
MEERGADLFQGTPEHFRAYGRERRMSRDPAAATT